MYVKASVRKPGGMPGKGLNPKDQIVIYDVDDIAYFPQRNAAGVVIEEDIVMKPGRYAVSVYLTPGTASLSSNSDGDADAQGYRPQVVFSHPGNKQEIREFKTNWLGKNCIVVLRYCNGDPADLIGSPCNPAQLAVEYTGNNDGNANQFTFAQVSKGDDIAIYNGTDTLEEPRATITGAGLEFVGEGQYQTGSTAVALTSITGGSHGQVVTLMGGTGALTIAAGTNFILKGGIDFSGSEGSQITLRAFDAGGNALKWVEQSRYVS